MIPQARRPHRPVEVEGDASVQAARAHDRQYDGQKFLTRRNGALFATPLLAVLVLVETTDIIFAVDSIPAIFPVTQEPFLVFTANAFAILGLRAMYFLLADLVHRFIYLKLGLGLVLIWVGIKLLLQVDLYKMPTWLSLGVVAVIIAVSIAASLIATRRGVQEPEIGSVSHGDGVPMTEQRRKWTFLTNHGHVLIYVHRNPDARPGYRHSGGDH